MKIVVIPGVGYQSSVDTYDSFSKSIADKVGGNCSYEVYYWHDKEWTVPVEPTLRLDNWRQWFSEVVLEFKAVIENIDSLTPPEADCYLGHSAGSIIAIAQGKPCVSMASPAALVEPALMSRFFASKGIDPNKIALLNAIHKCDIIAHTINLKGVENWEYYGGLLSMIPLWAHTDYWTNSDVSDKIAEKIGGWQSQGVLPK
jgi:hypothetical protein